ncbi:MAG: TonB family protein [bacterium]
MRKRFYWFTTVSVAVHLLLLWALPHPSFNAPPDPSPESIKISLTRPNPQDRTSQEPEDETARTAQPPKSNDEKITEKKIKDQSPSRSSTAKNGEKNSATSERSENPPEKSETDPEGADLESASRSKEPQSEEPPNRETSPSDNTESDQGKTDNRYSALTKSPQFRSGSSSEGRSRTNEQQSKPKTTINESVESYEIVRDQPRETTNHRRLVIREPDEQRPDTKQIDVPVMNISRSPADTTAISPSSPQTPESTYSRNDPRKPLFNPLPQVPEWLEKTGQDARIILQYRINPNGNVDSVTVLNSSGYPELDSLAAEKLRQWKFESGTEQRRLVVFRFNLTQKS